VLPEGVQLVRQESPVVADGPCVEQAPRPEPLRSHVVLTHAVARETAVKAPLLQCPLRRAHHERRSHAHDACANVGSITGALVDVVVHVGHQGWVQAVLVVEDVVHGRREAQDVALREVVVAPNNAAAVGVKLHVHVHQALGHAPGLGQEGAGQLRELIPCDREGKPLTQAHPDKGYVVVASRGAPGEAEGGVPTVEGAPPTTLRGNQAGQEEGGVVAQALHARQRVEQDDGPSQHIGQAEHVDVAQAQQLPFGGQELRVALGDDGRPLLLVHKVLQQLLHRPHLVLGQVLLKVALEVAAQRVPEELSPDQGPGDGMHQTVAVPVHVHGQQPILAVVVGTHQGQGAPQVR
ncbi:unnamed protein product, partial [Ixodes persulcatus]